MNRRGVNTVVDVAFALFFLGIAVLVLSTVNLSETPEEDQFDADRTATVLGTSTFDVSYSVEPVLEEAVEESDHIKRVRDDQRQEHRVAHATMAAHVGNAALGNLAVDSERITETGQYYQAAIDDQLQNQLAGTQFETSVTAHWEPYPDAVVSGEATVGSDPPPNRDIRTSELRVPSGYESVRADAVETVENGEGYTAVAKLVARATIEGYLPVVESKHALERSDSSTTLTRYRYERLAKLLDDSDVEVVREAIEQTDADPTRANEQLIAALTSEIEPELRERFDSPDAAAQSLSTGTITITVRTWEP